MIDWNVWLLITGKLKINQCFHQVVSIVDVRPHWSLAFMMSFLSVILKWYSGYISVELMLLFCFCFSFFYCALFVIWYFKQNRMLYFLLFEYSLNLCSFNIGMLQVFNSWFAFLTCILIFYIFCTDDIITVLLEGKVN